MTLVWVGRRRVALLSLLVHFAVYHHRVGPVL